MTTFFNALKKLKDSVAADVEASEAKKLKYQEGHVRESLPVLLIKDIGIQSMAAVRLMQFAVDAKIPFGGEVMSRLIRYVYNMEIHWKADIEPGVTLVHGMGLVVSKQAHLSRNCTLSHNVTLGASWDAATGKSGAPSLGENVHVGPGAQLIGPITIGANSKIMPGATVVQSVPPNTVVKTPTVTLADRASNSKKNSARAEA